MNFQKVQRKNRKAISPVLATVILIAITLIAAIAIAGFVFGLFSGFTSSAQVSSVSTSIQKAVYAVGCGAAGTCTVNFQNTGTSNALVNSITLTYGGVTCAPTIAASVNIPATGASTAVSFSAAGTCLAGTAGEAFVGSAALSNGGQVPFSGTFF